jgi:hypothetical protein
MKHRHGHRTQHGHWLVDTDNNLKKWQFNVIISVRGYSSQQSLKVAIIKVGSGFPLPQQL